MQQRCKGVWPAVATPFARDGQVAANAFTEHCHSLLEGGAHGLGLLGTTGEASSLSVAERCRLLDDTVATGIDPRCLLPGTGACSLPDSVALTKHAAGHGCAGVLLVPPFYYRAVTDEGLYAFVAELLGAVAMPSLAVYLYHVPQFSGVPWPFAVIDRLVRDFPDQIAGVKDSSGDAEHLAALLEAFPKLSIFPGSETLLLEGMRRGAAGCISASANVNVSAIRDLYERSNDADASSLSRHVVHTRRILESKPLIPAVKSVLAVSTGNPEWSRLRPPLTALPSADAQALVAAFQESVDISLL